MYELEGDVQDDTQSESLPCLIFRHSTNLTLNGKRRGGDMDDGKEKNGKEDVQDYNSFETLPIPHSHFK